MRPVVVIDVASDDATPRRFAELLVETENARCANLANMAMVYFHDC